MTGIVHTIDAEGKSIGRIASVAAKALAGKRSVAYARNLCSGAKVMIINASKVSIPSKKMKDKAYLRYSGYPSGQTKTTLEEMIAKKGFEEVFRKAVYGMIPDNKLAAKMMKNLTVIK